MTTPDLDYIAAQKSRNRAIGLALFGFVALVFVISLAKMDAAHKAFQQGKGPYATSTAKP
jgi:hypothetical protein